MAETPFTPLLVFLGLTAGCYAFGTWLGKTAAGLSGRDITVHGDWGGIIGGLVGLGLFFGELVGRIVT
jgi:hypothetical protein